MARGQKSTSINDVNFSMHGHDESAVERELLSIEHSGIAMASAPIVESEYVVFKLVDTKRKGRVYIDGIDDVINPETGRQERIWLLSGTSTIWSTQLVDILSDKDYVRNNRKSLQFESGILRVPRWDALTLDFIRNCRHLIDNPKRRSGSKTEFFEYDPAKQQKVALEREMLELDMATEAKVIPMEKARKLASFFGIVLFDELGFPKTDDGIRRELMMFAKKNPILFQKNLNSKEVEVAYLVRKGILDAKIDLGGENGNTSWANGRIICKVPLSRKAYEYLIELAMTNSQEGKEFLEELEKQVK